MEEFQRIEDEWAAIVVRRDVEAAEQLLADDFVLTSEGGVSDYVTREQWLATLPQLETRELTCTVDQAREFDDIAVVRAHLHWEASLGNRDLTGTYVIVDVFTRTPTGWRASWRISTRLPRE
jgi:ketosteroid isomerase-like protein